MRLNVGIKEQKPGVFVVTPEGRLDSETYLLFEEKVKSLLVASTKALVLDMKELEYISSAGLNVIFQAKKALDKDKGTLVVANLQPQIKKVFDIVRAMPNSPVFESMEEADRYLDLIQKKEIERQGGQAS